MFGGGGAGAVLNECKVPGSEDAGLLEDAELVWCEGHVQCAGGCSEYEGDALSK